MGTGQYHQVTAWRCWLSPAQVEVLVAIIYYYNPILLTAVHRCLTLWFWAEPVEAQDWLHYLVWSHKSVNGVQTGQKAKSGLGMTRGPEGAALAAKAAPATQSPKSDSPTATSSSKQLSWNRLSAVKLKAISKQTASCSHLSWKASCFAWKQPFFALVIG